MAAQGKLFESHVAWVASLRARHTMQAANPPIFLPERFNDAIDFESPVYRSMTGSTGSSTMTRGSSTMSTGSSTMTRSWKSVCDDIDLDFEPAVYHSESRARMHPPLVRRQRAFVHSSQPDSSLR